MKGYVNWRILNTDGDLVNKGGGKNDVNGGFLEKITLALNVPQNFDANAGSSANQVVPMYGESIDQAYIPSDEGGTDTTDITFTSAGLTDHGRVGAWINGDGCDFIMKTELDPSWNTFDATTNTLTSSNTCTHMRFMINDIPGDGSATVAMNTIQWAKIKTWEGTNSSGNVITHMAYANYTFSANSVLIGPNDTLVVDWTLDIGTVTP